MKIIASLLFAVLISASSYAAVSAVPDFATPSRAVGSPVALPADVDSAVAMDPVVDQALAVAVSRETDEGSAAPAKKKSLAASGAGWLLIAVFLALAAVNSRKRPMRLLKARSNQDR